jgi:hypothetical protein
MEDSSIYGKIYTTCKQSFRGNAEARQREYRVNYLKAGCGEYGHILNEESAASGKNFLLPICHDAAKKRDFSGKGVGERTFTNMLSSQAMCFNIFEPLNHDKLLCKKVLSNFIPDIFAVNSLAIEYTPAKNIFQDQSGKTGVDCDILIEATNIDSKPIIIVIETKFVEPEFSICGYRKSTHKNPCPSDIHIKASTSNCLYEKNKKPPYLYWQRTIEHSVLKDGAIPDMGCPFGDNKWQLWVNYALAQEEAKRRQASKAYFAVCAFSKNTRLINPKNNPLEHFRSLISAPETVVLIEIDELIDVIREESQNRDENYLVWVSGLTARYAGIG